MKTGDKVRVLHLEDEGTCLVPATIIGEGNLPDSVKVRLEDGTEKTTLTVYVSPPADDDPGTYRTYADKLHGMGLGTGIG
jgi:hypothetical protein